MHPKLKYTEITPIILELSDSNLHQCAAKSTFILIIQVDCGKFLGVVTILEFLKTPTVPGGCRAIIATL